MQEEYIGLELCMEITSAWSYARRSRTDFVDMVTWRDVVNELRTLNECLRGYVLSLCSHFTGMMR